MNRLRKAIRKWLQIKDPQVPRDWGKELSEAVERYRREATKEFESIIKQLRPVNCINCDKALIEHRDAIYTNHKGQKFCSHECIDANQLTKGEKNEIR